jgi:predicted nucleic-acid-binding protein
MQTMEFVAGLTIEQALLKATKTTKESDEQIEAIINDVVMIVDKKTDITKALNEYHQKQKFKYEIEMLKRVR